MSASPSQLADILVRTGAMTPKQKQFLLQEQQTWGGHLPALIVELGLLQEDQLLQLLSHELQIPIADFGRLLTLPADIQDQIPASLCERYDLIPIGIDQSHQKIKIAASDPTHSQMIEEIQAHTQLRIELYLAGVTAIRRALRVYYYGESTGEALQTVPSLFPQSYGTQHSYQSQGSQPSMGSAPPSREQYPHLSVPIEPDPIRAIQPPPGHVSPANAGWQRLEHKIGQLEQKLRRICYEQNQRESKLEREIASLRGKLHDRLKEQRIFLKGLLDLLADNGHLDKQQILKLLDTISQK